MKALLAAACLVILPPSLALADISPPEPDGGAAQRSDAGTVIENDKTGCSLMPGGPVREAGALLVAGSFSLLFLLNRRKRGT